MVMKSMTIALFGALCLNHAALGANVLVEAESFQTLGGWVVDQQFMDQMGSPMLLAHGLGEPVADATTTVTLPVAGTWRIWVRTRDWAATWNVKGSPGRFQLVVDGKTLATTFGNEGAAWHWQDGGTVALGATAKLALHDLTGFDGRCDAILFANDTAFVPPDGGEKLAALRRQLLGLPDQPVTAGSYDLVVVGGGMAGCTAAISAARHGLKVALIQDRPVLGGNNSSEVRVWLGGSVGRPFPKIGNVVKELEPPTKGYGASGHGYEEGDAKKQKIILAEKNISLFLNVHVGRVIKEGAAVAAVIGRSIRTGQELRFDGRYFADCTGDGTVGFLAGADYRVGREARSETKERSAPEKADHQVMGTSIMWNAVSAKNAPPFPDCPWALRFTEATCQNTTSGDWTWEVGFFLDQVADAERIRDYGLRAIYGNWDFQRNQSANRAKYQGMKLGWVNYVGGKRESRRLLGDVILRVDAEKWDFPDSCVGTSWGVDVHYPARKNLQDFPDEPFRSCMGPGGKGGGGIPYRSLYSRNVPNLFMAGRNISVTHLALGTVRVMRTGGMMGEAVGMAASVAKAHNCQPRQVYEQHLDELKGLFVKGVPSPKE
jgi:hypothetical protein